MFQRNTSAASGELNKNQHSRRMLDRAVRSTLETLEERRMFVAFMAPVAVPGGVYNVAEGSSVLVSGLGSSDSDGQIVSYEWDTNYSGGRGFRPRFIGSKFKFQASDSGVRTIALRVTDNDGQSHMATTTVNISDVAPTITLSGPNNAAEGQSFGITWSHTDPGQSDAVTAWEIDWGDGQITTVAGNVNAATHAYAEDGNYQIDLTATQVDATTSVTHNIAITNEAPQVNASTTTPSVDEGDTVNLTFAAPNRAGTIEEWVVDWGDGNIDVLPANATGATHQYTDDGNFAATISALEPDGGKGTATVNYTVANVKPVIGITGLPSSEDEGQVISVGSTMSDVGADDSHIYGWTVYRDGQHFVLPGNVVVNGTNFSFTPTDDGNYVIRLTVLDDDNGSTTVNSDPIVVSNVNPTANISGTPMGNIDEGDLVSLTVNPSDDGEEDTFTYAWTVSKDGDEYLLPDGTNTSSDTFEFVPRDNGNYIATVVVTDDDEGTVQVATSAIAVDNVAPVGAITGEPVGNVNEGSSVSLGTTVTDAGEDDTHTYAWSVEKDGQPFTLPGNISTTASTFAFVPTDNGDYLVTLVVTDDDSATDTITTGTITVVNVAPVGDIQGPSTIAEGASPFFVNDITDAGSADLLTYAWSVEKDGQTFTLPGGTDTTSASFSFIPTDNGAYVVTLVVEDDEGAQLTRTHNIAVTNADPEATIDNLPSSGNEGSAINVSSTVTDDGEDDNHTYGWTVYRDGQHFVLPGNVVVNTQNFTFTPTDDGSYVVRLTVLDDDNGSVTVNSDPIIVGNVDPTATISGEPGNSIDEGSTVSLTANPADAGDEDTFNYAWSVTRDGQAYSLADGTDTESVTFDFIPRDNGSYIATLIVTDDNGGDFTIATAAIVVDNVNPSANITNLPIGNIDEGDTVSLGSSVTDAGTDDLHSFTWSVEKDGQPFALPGNVSTTGSSFAFVPTDNGSYVVTLVVEDMDGGIDTVTSTAIVVDNVAPAAIVSGDSAANEGGTVNYSVAVTDPSVDTHTYLWSVEKDGQTFTLPGGLDVISSTFSFVPTDEGAYVVSVVVTDDDNGTNTYTHNLTVENVAPTPTIVGAPVSEDEGEVINLTSSVSEPGADDVYDYLWSVTKDGQAFGSTATTSGYDFTPDDDGTYIVTLVTTDNDGDFASTTATITVNNVDPGVVIGGEPVGHINEGDSVNLTTSVSDAGTADNHTYQWTVTLDGVDYDPGVATDGSTLSFVTRDNGTYVATVKVTDDDNGTVTVNSLDIEVDNVDPTVSIDNLPVGSVNEGSTISLGTGYSDPGQDDEHTYLWSVEKDGQPFTLPGYILTTTGTFSFVPTDNGDYVVKLVITDDDGGTFTATSSTITVDNVDPAPTIAGNGSVDEAHSITLTATPHDAGTADNHTYSWSVTKDGQNYVLPGGLDTTSSTFSFTPSRHGNYIATVVVTDDDGGSESATHNITVNNLPPVVGITGLPSNARSEGYTFNLNSTVNEPGADSSLTYAWSVTRNGQLLTLPGNIVTNASTFVFDATDNGLYRITVAVTDSGGATGTSTTSNITITNANPNATMDGIPVTSIPENTPVELEVTADDPGTEDTFTYLWSVTKDGLAYTLPNGTATTGTSFEFTPPDNGTYIVSVRVKDDDNGTTTIDSGAIIVDNAPPTADITGEPSQSQLEGLLVSLSSSIFDASPNDTHTYLWSVTKDGQPFTLPGNVSTTGNTFAFKPTDNGSYVASLTVTDDDGAHVTVTSDSIVITNANPTGTISGPASVNEGGTASVTASITDAGSADTHSYLWSVEKDGHSYTLPGGTVVNQAAFEFTPSDNGSYVLTVVVTDDDNGQVTLTHNLTVNNVAPFGNIFGPTDAEEGDSLDYSVSVLDPGALDTHTYLWSVTKDGQAYTLPGGTVLNGTDLNFTPTDEGEYVVSVTITDDDSGVSTATLDVTVTNANPTASIGNVPVGSINEGTPVSLTSTASDVGENDLLTYSWSVKKDGQTFTLPGGTVTDSGSFDFTPTDNGSYVVTLVVSDTDGGSVSVSSAAIHVDNVAPVAGIDAQPTTGNEGSGLSFEGDVSDAGSADSHVYTWTVSKDGHVYALPGGTVSNAIDFSFTPTDNGTYVVTFAVTDKDGDTDSVESDPVVVDNVAPTGNITGTASANEGSSVGLTANPSDAGSDDEFTYAWSVEKDNQAYALPGGTATTSSTLSFVPDDEGTYVATVVITDDDGDSVTLTKTVTVSNVPPVVALTGVPSTGAEGTEITIGSTVSDVGVNDDLTYGWTIRRDGEVITLDGVAMNESTLTFTPPDNGSYTVRLTVLDGDTGSTTVNSAAIVITNVLPAVAITGAPAHSDEGVEITLGSEVTDAGSADETAGFTYLWTVKRGVTTVLTGDSAELDFTPGLHGTYTVILTVTDKDAGVTTTTATTIEVDNVAPKNVQITGIPTSITEAEDAQISATGTDAPEDSLSYSWEVFRNGSYFGSYQGQSFLFDPHARGQFEIVLTATDSYGAETSTTELVTVDNVAPEGSVTAPGELLIGETATFGLDIADVPPSQQLTVTWNFGDGSAPVVKNYTGSQTNLSISHLYTQSGNFAVTVTVSDGIDTTTIEKNARIVRAAVRPDPLDTSKNALMVIGRNTADIIKVEPSSVSGRWKVSLDGVSLGSNFNPTSRAIIYGNGGANTIAVIGGISAVVYAGDAGSIVQTGSGNDIIFGTPGADQLSGGAGRDIVIGNGGGDTLRGGDSEDVIVADTVNWSSNNNSVKAALSTWAGTGSFAARVAGMKATGLFGAGKLIADGVQDQLYGETQSDWFVLNTSIDRLRDFASATDVAN